MSGKWPHISVLLKEAVAALHVKPNGIYIDGTMGAGGHAVEIAKRLDLQHGRLFGFDLDPQAIEIASERLRDYSSCIELIHRSYTEMVAEMERRGIASVDGILLDLGYSSMQIDDPERGLSFQHDAPLDMRFNRDQLLTAAEIVNEWSRDRLIEIFKEYGEERWSKRVAERIVEKRLNSPIETTSQLANLIVEAIPKAAQHSKGPKKAAHPATRIFQALRIAVNKELENLYLGLDVAFELLNSDGRLVVISFHSLEDRIVKQFMRSKVQGCTCPPDLPACVCGFEPTAEVFPDIPPSNEEIEANPRARSARLRALRKL